MDKNEIISGYNFSNTCNVIFSRYVSYEEYENLDHSKIIVLHVDILWSIVHEKIFFYEVG